VVDSSYYENGFFFLLLHAAVYTGQYTCRIPSRDLHQACLNTSSPDQGKAVVFVDKVEMQLSILMKENQQLKSQQASLGHENQNLAQENQKLAQENQRLNDRLQDIENQTLHVNDRLVVVENQSQEQITENKGLDSRLESLENQSLSNRLESLENQSLSNRLESLENQSEQKA
jgi:hypothetical protein